MSDVAVICGGAEGIFSEIELARKLCEQADALANFFVINDLIAIFSGQCRAVTLHPDKLLTWLAVRRAENLPPPDSVWAHRKNALVTHTAVQFGSGGAESGSSALFACKIAREQGFDKILLCGAPMDTQAKHFMRHRPWAACDSFRDAWKTHQVLFAPYARSFSGWTAELFGRPSIEFLQSAGPRASAT